MISPCEYNTLANHVADDLSCNNFSSFHSKVPNMNPSPTPLPFQLLDLLLDPTVDCDTTTLALAVR